MPFPLGCILPPQEQDYLLATEALRGDSHAEDTLYLGSVSFVVNAARKYDVQKWFSPSDYPDIADEAFAKCYEHLERYQGLGRFRNWVLGYAKNIMRNRWRKQCTARRNQSLLESLATSQLRHLDPLILLVWLELNRYLWDTFYRLTALEQRIIYQCVFCGTPPPRPGVSADLQACAPALRRRPGNIPLELPASVPIGRALFRTQKRCYFIILQEKCQLCFPERRRIIISVA